jgi:hypothetical protein
MSPTVLRCYESANSNGPYEFEDSDASAFVVRLSHSTATLNLKEKAVFWSVAGSVAGWSVAGTVLISAELPGLCDCTMLQMPAEVLHIQV